MTINPKFNLASAIAAAEADGSQWEALARRLIAQQAKPKPSRSRKSSGPQTWAHVRLQDGRDFLTSAYAKASPKLTEAAHAASAQFRARMEDSGDRSDYDGFGPRVFLDPEVEPVPVAHVAILTEAADIERVRDFAFEQRGRRQGWWEKWREANPTEEEKGALRAKAIEAGNKIWGTIPAAAAKLRAEQKRIAA